MFRHAESIVVVNTDKLDKEESKFLGALLDDTIPFDAAVDKAVVILLGDLFKDNQNADLDKTDPTVLHNQLKTKFVDRVVQRIRNVISL